VGQGLHDGLYDEVTERRIDGRRRRRVARRAPAGARAAGAGAFLAAVALGLQHVFDPDAGEEIVLEIDAAGEPLDEQAVLVDFDPTSVHRSRAHVRPWLLTAPA
jgi:hypothetical protein